MADVQATTALAEPMCQGAFTPPCLSPVRLPLVMPAETATPTTFSTRVVTLKPKS